MNKGKRYAIAKDVAKDLANRVEKLSEKRKQKITYFEALIGGRPTQREKELFMSFSIAQVLDEEDEKEGRNNNE